MANDARESLLEEIRENYTLSNAEELLELIETSPWLTLKCSEAIRAMQQNMANLQKSAKELSPDDRNQNHNALLKAHELLAEKYRELSEKYDKAVNQCLQLASKSLDMSTKYDVLVDKYLESRQKVSK